MGWCPRRRCSGECGDIKPRMVQTACLALMEPPGRLLCQLWDHPGVAAGFPVARPLYDSCIGQMSYREVSVFSPMRSLTIFGLTPVFRAPLRMIA